MNVEQFLPEEFKQDEQDYWQRRNNFLSDYEGKWIAFHNKEVIASGDSIYEVTLLALQKSNSCAYITKVGEEDKLMVKVRRQEFSSSRTMRRTIEKLNPLLTHSQHWIYHQTPAIANSALVGFKIGRPNVLCSKKSPKNRDVQSATGIWQ